MGRMKFAGFVRNVTVAVANSGLAAAEKKDALAALTDRAKNLSEGMGRNGALEALKWAKQDEE